MIFDKADEVVEELFESHPYRYQIGLETSMKDSDFILDCINLFYYKCHKINLNHGGSYIVSLDWIKNKKATNPINDDVNKYFINKYCK